MNTNSKLKTQTTYIYQFIDNDDNSVLGFIILGIENNGKSIEFRRIVLTKTNTGTGQIAMKKVQQYCKEHLGCKHIWLDVFSNNQRAQHIYKKLGYQYIDSKGRDGRTLLFFEKNL